MPALYFTIDFNGPSETIFALIADLAHYDRWLPRSGAFGSVAQVSHSPVGIDTTYVDTGPNGTMRGSITAYQPPAHIAFRQSMPVKLLLPMQELAVRFGDAPGQRIHKGPVSIRYWWMECARRASRAARHLD